MYRGKRESHHSKQKMCQGFIHTKTYSNPGTDIVTLKNVSESIDELKGNTPENLT